MVNYEKFTLNNGLRVLVHRDTSSPVVAFNLVYDVGAKDESPDRTGFAHLFEHLMFGGSANIPYFDRPLQEVGGENNAFTSNDITNYYMTVPAQNLETAFWLESDRMLELDFSERSLEVQRNVVIEEFKQRYLNQPYGDIWLLLRPMAYKMHPYQWATIGKDISHIAEASLDEVKSFFYSHYAPNNAVLVVSGDVKADQIYRLADKWFSPIPQRSVIARNLPVEPPQMESRRMEVEREVPFDSIYMTFHMCGKTAKDYHGTDLISDILSNGQSSRLYQELVKEKQMFSELNAYILGSHDPGLFVFSGKPIQGISVEAAEKAIWNSINKLKSKSVKKRELDKVKNKVESTIMYSRVSVLNKAMNLAFHELLTCADDYNHEVSKYMAVTPDDIQRLANEMLVPANCSTLIYKSKKRSS